MRQSEVVSCLTAAVGQLAGISDSALRGEAHALATLLQSFCDRVSAVPAVADDSSAESNAIDGNEDSGEKRWTVAELKQVERPVPFEPQVYATGAWMGREKTFHRQSCFMVRYSEPMDLEIALQLGYKPCEHCGGLRTEVSPLQLASDLDTLLHHVGEVREFMLGDYTGLISIFDASKILGRDMWELEKECRAEARKQLRRVKGDRYFQLCGGRVNVLRYKAHRKDKRYSFRFSRPDCVQYSKQYGPLSYPHGWAGGVNTTPPRRKRGGWGRD